MHVMVKSSQQAQPCTPHREQHAGVRLAAAVDPPQDVHLLQQAAAVRHAHKRPETSALKDCSNQSKRLLATSDGHLATRRMHQQLWLRQGTAKPEGYSAHPPSAQCPTAPARPGTS